MAPPSREYIHGINPCFEVIRAGRRTIYEGFINQATVRQPRLAKLMQFMQQRSITVHLVDKQRLFELARSKEHQGAVLKTSTYAYRSFSDLLGHPRLLLLDNVEDPTNVGAIIRSAEIFGFHAICLPTKGTPEIYPSVVKVSVGATEHLAICRDHSANNYVKAAMDAGYCTIALDGKGSTALPDLSVPAATKILLVIGGEDKSVGQFILNSADFIAKIPMSGQVNSLNASVAAGIAMYHMNQLLTGDAAPHAR